MLNNKNIGIVIATYNRSMEVDRTLSCMCLEKNMPGKIIVVDQSRDQKTKEVVKKYTKKLPVEYVYSNRPSSSISKNIGINKLKKYYPIIIILDDDVDLYKGYLSEMVSEFNTNNKVMALGGVDANPVVPKNESWIYQKFLRFFFLPYGSNKAFTINGPYGINGNPKISAKISDAQWLNGFNMAFRREVFNNYKMPESRGYNVLEDIDSSYYVYKKYGIGSLVITPKCKTHHRFSPVARYAERKRIFVNHEDHFYFYYQYLNDFVNSFKLAWSLTGIILGNLVRACASPSENNFNALKFNFEAIVYCIKHRKKIKKGVLREFLDNDLNMIV